MEWLIYFKLLLTGILRSSNDEQQVAIKVLKDNAGRNAEEDFVREVSIMSAFRHPNILTLIGVVYRGMVSKICDIYIYFFFVINCH